MRTLGHAYSRTLRAESEQLVVETGPYALVRHPGYLGSIMTWFGFALTSAACRWQRSLARSLGNAYRHRIDAEEQLLSRDLPAYSRYKARTKRLIPYICEQRPANLRHGTPDPRVGGLIEPSMTPSSFGSVACAELRPLPATYSPVSRAACRSPPHRPCVCACRCAPSAASSSALQLRLLHRHRSRHGPAFASGSPSRSSLHRSASSRRCRQHNRPRMLAPSSQQANDAARSRTAATQMRSLRPFESVRPAVHRPPAISSQREADLRALHRSPSKRFQSFTRGSAQTARDRQRRRPAAGSPAAVPSRRLVSCASRAGRARSGWTS